MKNSAASPKRRQILQWGGVSLFAATLIAYFGRGGKTNSARIVPETPALSKNRVQPLSSSSVEASEPVGITDEGLHALLHTEFKFERADELPLSGTLIEITPTRRLDAPDATYDAFNLLFKVTGGFPKDGAICRISHPRLIPSDVFLTPVGRPLEGEALLEAAFSIRV